MGPHVGDQYRLPAYRNIHRDHCAHAREDRVAVDRDRVVLRKAEPEFLRRPSVSDLGAVLLAQRVDESIERLVVVAVGVEAVRPLEPSGLGHDRRRGMQRLPKRPGGFHQRKSPEGGSTIRTAYAAQQHLVPKRLGLPVEHHEVRSKQQAGDTEIPGTAVDPRIEGDPRTREGTIGHQDRLAAQGVIHDLMPPEDVERIGAGLVVDDEPQDAISLPEESGTRGGNDLGIRESGNGVPGESTVENAGIRHRAGAIEIERILAASACQHDRAYGGNRQPHSPVNAFLRHRVPRAQVPVLSDLGHSALL